MGAKIEFFQHHLNEEIERPEGVRTQWQLITPEYATRVLSEFEKWIDDHPDEKKNRNVTQATVEKYAADMKAGKWGRNHQGIAFDKDGILMDGQHRLWAVVESGVSVMMPVTYGLDREAMLTIDAGRARTTADVAAIAGFSGVRPLHIAVARNIVRGVSKVTKGLTRMQELELLREHIRAVEFTLSLFPKSKVTGISRAPVLGAIGRAFYTQSHDKLRRFAEVLVSGVVSGDPHEHIIITLRNWLIMDRDGTLDRRVVYGKTARALLAYIKGQTLRNLYATEEELFSIPTMKSKR